MYKLHHRAILSVASELSMMMMAVQRNQLSQELHFSSSTSLSQDQVEILCQLFLFAITLQLFELLFIRLFSWALSSFKLASKLGRCPPLWNMWLTTEPPLLNYASSPCTLHTPTERISHLSSFSNVLWFEKLFDAQEWLRLTHRAAQENGKGSEWLFLIFGPRNSRLRPLSRVVSTGQTWRQLSHQDQIFVLLLVPINVQYMYCYALILFLFIVTTEFV